MKLIEDKITVDPPHALSKSDVRLILAAVPETWLEGITTVRLSAALYQSQNPNHNRFSKTFVITSRGSTKEQTLWRVLSDLAARGLGVRFLLWHRLQQRDASRVRRAVAPLVAQLLPELSRKQVGVGE
jgi:hypothetical protein